MLGYTLMKYGKKGFLKQAIENTKHKKYNFAYIKITSKWNETIIKI